MALSLVRSTGWVLLAAGLLFFIQTVQLVLGSQSYFGLGVFSFVLQGGLGALAESVILTLVCLGAGGWLVHS